MVKTHLWFCPNPGVMVSDALRLTRDRISLRLLVVTSVILGLVVELVPVVKVVAPIGFVWSTP